MQETLSSKEFNIDEIALLLVEGWISISIDETRLIMNSEAKLFYFFLFKCKYVNGTITMTATF